MKSYKLRLRFNKEQEKLAWDYAYTARHFWNVLVDIDRRNNRGEFDSILSERGNETYYSKFYDREIYKLSQSDYLNLAKIVISQQYEDNNDKWSWYYRLNQSFIYAHLVKELVKIKRLNKGKLNFRSVTNHTPSFNVRCDVSANKKRPSRIYLKDNGKLQVPTLGDVAIGKINPNIDLNGKKKVAQVSYDNKYWYLSYSYKEEDKLVELPDYTDGVGVDLGIKTLATVSDGTQVPNINTFRRVRILNKRLKRLQRKVSRKYLINKCNKYNKTKNIKKLEKQIKLIYRKLRNIRLNHIREFVSKLVKQQPMYIAIEDLNVKGMMRNKYLAKAIANCGFYTIREHLIRKAKERHIAVRLVERFYPSSKICSHCGYYKKDLKLSERIFKCSNCQTQIDRDYNAAVNLAQTTQYQLA